MKNLSQIRKNVRNLQDERFKIEVGLLRSFPMVPYARNLNQQILGLLKEIEKSAFVPSSKLNLNTTRRKKEEKRKRGGPR